jgi:hypothetical protein
MAKVSEENALLTVAWISVYMKICLSKDDKEIIDQSTWVSRENKWDFESMF